MKTKTAVVEQLQKEERRMEVERQARERDRQTP